MTRVPGLTRAPGRARLRVAFATPQLRRCQATAAVARIVDVATLVAVSVHLFGRAGAAGVAIFGVVRTLVPAVGTPLVTAAAGRRAPGRTLLACLLTAALTSVGVGVLMAIDGPIAVILTLSGVAGIALSCLRPLVTALLPGYIRGPAELVATNAAAAMLDTSATIVGPLLAGALLATVGDAWVLHVSAAALAAVGVSVVSLDPPGPAASHEGGWRSYLRDVTTGVHALGASGPVRVVVLLTTTQTFVRGAVNVLVVSLAIERLDMGQGGVGLLIGAIGVGGLLGFPLAVRVAGAGRLARALGVALVLWGAPLAAVAVADEPIVALGLFAVVGVGNTLVDITSDTLLQRLVPAGTLPRVLGAFDAVLFAGMALGSVVAERLLALASLRLGLLALGALLPAAAAIAAVALVRLDRALRSRDADVSLLQINAIFSPLVLATVDHLARSATVETHRPGEAIVTEGDHGEHLFLIEAGTVDVHRDGTAVAALGPGDAFGEMSLLEGLPRTATVVARTTVRTRSLRREDFLSALDTDEDAHDAAHQLIRDRRRG